jgi:hypothetical protein
VHCAAFSSSVIKFQNTAGTPTTSRPGRRPACEQEHQDEVSGDQGGGGGGVHQGQQAVPITPAIRPGRPVCDQDQ